MNCEKYMPPNKENYSDFSTWWHAQTGTWQITPRAVKIFIDKRLSCWDSAPPIDPSIYAHALGCDVIIEDVPAGRLEVSMSQARIRLPLHQSAEKQRFTAAHELAHLLLLEREGNLVRHSFQVATKNIRPNRERYLHRIRLEGLCDFIARVILVPPENLRGRFSSHGSIAFSTIAELAKEFDVPIPVVFERLVEDGYIPKHPGYVLLRYGANEVTGKDHKWRVAARSVPGVEFGKKFPVRNQSLKSLGIELPTPEEMITQSDIREFRFHIEAINWIMRILHFEADLCPWLLVSVELIQQVRYNHVTGSQTILPLV
jgi:hypothetical protein